MEQINVTKTNSHNDIPYAVSWSGGKDSTLALYKTIKKWDYPPSYLLTMMIEDGSRSRSHGLKKEILEAQAASLNIPIIFCTCSWATYEEEFIKSLGSLRSHGIKRMVFGDIKIPNDPEWSTHRQWADRVCHSAGLESIQPLWDEIHEHLLEEFFGHHFKAQFISLRKDLIDKKYLGTYMTQEILDIFEKNDIDRCGERGEYHTVVTDGPLFKAPLDLFFNDDHISERHNYWHVDLQI